MKWQVFDLFAPDDLKMESRSSIYHHLQGFHKNVRTIIGEFEVHSLSSSVCNVIVVEWSPDRGEPSQRWWPVHKWLCPKTSFGWHICLRRWVAAAATANARVRFRLETLNLVQSVKTSLAWICNAWAQRWRIVQWEFHKMMTKFWPSCTWWPLKCGQGHLYANTSKVLIRTIIDVNFKYSV
jgi:hypothetical protein